MGLFDSVVRSVERQAIHNQTKARISYDRKLTSAYDSTDDASRKSAIAKEIRANRDAIKANNEAFRNLR